MNIKQFKNVLAVYNGLNKKVFLGGVFYIRDTILKVKFKSNLLGFFFYKSGNTDDFTGLCGILRADGTEDLRNCTDPLRTFICKKSSVFLKRPKLDLLLEVDNCNKKITVGEGGGGSK